MLQTFFLTVVSIDCQRLELADLLRQGVEQPQKIQIPGQDGQHQSAEHMKGVVRGSGPAKTAGGSYKSQTSSWINGAKSIWKARTARGGSMVLVSSGDQGHLPTLYSRDSASFSFSPWSQAFITSMSLTKRTA